MKCCSGPWISVASGISPRVGNMAKAEWKMFSIIVYLNISKLSWPTLKCLEKTTKKPHAPWRKNAAKICELCISFYLYFLYRSKQEKIWVDLPCFVSITKVLYERRLTSTNTAFTICKPLSKCLHLILVKILQVRILQLCLLFLFPHK